MLGVALSLTATALVSVLIVLFVRKHAVATFPWFFAYLNAEVVITAIRLSFRGEYVTTYKVFWTTEAFYAVLALCVLHEVFRRVFIAFYLFRGFALIFPSVVLTIALVTFEGAARVPQAVPQLVRLVLAVGITAKYVEVGLFATFLLLAVILGVPWHTHAFGIVQGFAVSSLGSWLSYLLSSEFGIRAPAIAVYGPPMAYIVAVLIWCVTFLQQESPVVQQHWTTTVTPTELLEELKDGTRTLWRYINKGDGR